MVEDYLLVRPFGCCSVSPFQAVDSAHAQPVLDSKHEDIWECAYIVAAQRLSAPHLSALPIILLPS